MVATLTDDLPYCITESSTIFSNFETFYRTDVGNPRLFPAQFFDFKYYLKFCFSSSYP